MSTNIETTLDVLRNVYKANAASIPINIETYWSAIKDAVECFSSSRTNDEIESWINMFVVLFCVGRRLLSAFWCWTSFVECFFVLVVISLAFRMVQEGFGQEQATSVCVLLHSLCNDVMDIDEFMSKIRELGWQKEQIMKFLDMTERTDLTKEETDFLEKARKQKRNCVRTSVKKDWAADRSETGSVASVFPRTQRPPAALATTSSNLREIDNFVGSDDDPVIEEGSDEEQLTEDDEAMEQSEDDGIDDPMDDPMDDPLDDPVDDPMAGEDESESLCLCVFDKVCVRVFLTKERRKCQMRR